MDDFARLTVDHTIRMTEAILATREVSWPVAREGILRIATSLSNEYPRSAAGIRRSLLRYVSRRDTRIKLPGQDSRRQFYAAASDRRSSTRYRLRQQY